MRAARAATLTLLFAASCTPRAVVPPSRYLPGTLSRALATIDSPGGRQLARSSLEHCESLLSATAARAWRKAIADQHATGWIALEVCSNFYIGQAFIDTPSGPRLLLSTAHARVRSFDVSPDDMAALRATATETWNRDSPACRSFVHEDGIALLWTVVAEGHLQQDLVLGPGRPEADEPAKGCAMMRKVFREVVARTTNGADLKWFLEN